MALVVRLGDTNSWTGGADAILTILACVGSTFYSTMDSAQMCHESTS